MNKEALLSPDEIAAITERDDCYTDQDMNLLYVSSSVIDRRRLLRHCEAIAAENKAQADKLAKVRLLRDRWLAEASEAERLANQCQDKGLTTARDIHKADAAEFRANAAALTAILEEA